MPLHFESKIGDISNEAFAEQGLAALNDPRGWGQAGFTFKSDSSSKYRVILAEPGEVDSLCLPLKTGGRVSCQNGDVVALNANRWRNATDDWDHSKDEYRQYMFNHEVGHLIGQFHPANRCPKPGEVEAVMAQQTKGLEGCQGNPWPLDWEILGASKRPANFAPTPDVEPAVRAVNPGGGVPGAGAAATPPVPASETTAEVPDDEAAPVQTTTSPNPSDAVDLPEAIATDATTTIPAEPSAKERQLADASLSGLQRSAPVKSDDGTSLPVIIVLAFMAITLVSLGIALIMKWRSRDADAWRPDDDLGDGHPMPDEINPEHTEGWESASISEFAGWAVQLGGGAGHRGALTWVTPSRWTSDQTSRLLEAIDELDPHSADPAALAACISGLLRIRHDLRPREGEGLGVVLVGPTQLVAAVLGTAEATERREDRIISTRRQGVVRLSGGEEARLTLTVAQTGNDWPAGTVTVTGPDSDVEAARHLDALTQASAPPAI